MAAKAIHGHPTALLLAAAFVLGRCLRGAAEPLPPASNPARETAVPAAAATAPPANDTGASGSVGPLVVCVVPWEPIAMCNPAATSYVAGARAQGACFRCLLPSHTAKLASRALPPSRLACQAAQPAYCGRCKCRPRWSGMLSHTADPRALASPPTNAGTHTVQNIPAPAAANFTGHDVQLVRKAAAMLGLQEGRDFAFRVSGCGCSLTYGHAYCSGFGRPWP